MIQWCPSLLFFVILALSIILASGSFDPLSMSSTQGITFTGSSDQTSFGSSVSNAGDINGDGIDDILIGNPSYKSNTGIVYVVYGGNDLSNLSFDEDLDSSQGFKIEGAASGDGFGTSLTALGDVNGDGVDDFLIIASQAYSDYGAVYVIYGSKSKLSNIDLSSGLSLSRGFTIRPTSGRSAIGLVANLAGDVNGDGVSDIILSMPGYWVPSSSQNNQGIVYVIYGSGKNSPDITLTESVDPSQGFLIRGPFNTLYFGLSVSTAGDINDDGIDDIIIGGLDFANLVGHVYVFYGSKENPASIDLNNGLNPIQGFAIARAVSSSYFGFSVSHAGDVNNDGIDDIAIGAPQENTYGSVYILYGKKGGYSNISLADASISSSVTTISSSDCIMTGTIVSRAGDLNNDGVDDLYILCNNDTGITPTPNAAVTFVIYGSNSGKIPDMSLSASLPETQGLLIVTDPITSWLEQKFSSGDFNNDNLPDILLGAPLAENNIGSASIIFGSNGCQKNCSKCSSSTVCLECFEGLELYKSQCVAACPKGTFLLENNCLDCPEGCAECTSSTICKSCTGNFVLLSSQRCISDSKSSQANLTGAAFDGVSVLGSSVAVGTSLPTNFGLVAKILRNIRYLNITVSSDLEETFYTWKISSGFISMPKSWGDYSEPEMLPEVFDRYNLGSLFLVNYWKSLMMIVIGSSLYVVFRLLDIKNFRKKKNNTEVSKMSAALRSLNVFASNFTLTQVYGSLDDIIFFFVLQTRSADFHIDFGRASFALSVVLVLFGMVILGFHILILVRYRRSLRIMKDKSSEELKKFLEKHENFKMLFQDFKDTDLIKQSFLLIYVGRSIISNVIITTLFEYPLLQALLLTSLNVLILIYLLVSRPFKEKLNAAGQYFCEIILLLVNVSMLAMAIMNNSSSGSEEIIERFSKLVIIMNMTLVIGSLVFMLLTVGKALYMVYKEKKAQKKQQGKKEKVKILGGNDSLKIIAPQRGKVPVITVNQDQSIYDPLNLSRGQSFIENPSSEYHLHINNNLYHTTITPSQNLSDTSPQLNDSNLLPNSRVLHSIYRSPQIRKFSMKVSDHESSSPFGGIKMTHMTQPHESYIIPYMVSNHLNPEGLNNLGQENVNKDEIEKLNFSQNSSMVISESQKDQVPGQREKIKFIGKKIRRGPNLNMNDSEI